jgi:two-component system, OmpR family, response regulator
VTGRPKKIVLLDDSDLIRDLVRETLEAQGYEVVDTNTPFGFSNMLRREKPDLALLDVTMPTLRGDKLAEIAIQSGVACPIVLFSDRPAAELDTMAKAVKAAGYIRKTGDMDEVVRSIARFLK